MKFTPFYLCLMLIGASMIGPAIGKSWLLPGDQQRPYAEVRAKLLSEGWKPYKARHFADDPYCGLDGAHCREFPETLWCQQAGKPSCTMGFVKSSPRRYLVVRGALAEVPSATMMVDEIATPGEKFVKQYFYRSAP